MRDDDSVALCIVDCRETVAGVRPARAWAQLPPCIRLDIVCPGVVKESLCLTGDDNNTPAYRIKGYGVSMPRVWRFA